MPRRAWGASNYDISYETVHVSEILYESTSGKAIRVRLSPSRKRVWIPKSVIEDIPTIGKKDCTIEVEAWFAEKEELI